MRIIKIIVLSFLITGYVSAQGQPNIVYINCDDLGYGDVQVLNPERGKIPTPQVDSFPATKGNQLEQKFGHYPSANFRSGKLDIWDGGHRIPCMVLWPGHIAANLPDIQLYNIKMLRKKS